MILSEVPSMAVLEKYRLQVPENVNSEGFGTASIFDFGKVRESKSSKVLPN